MTTETTTFDVLIERLRTRAQEARSRAQRQHDAGLFRVASQSWSDAVWLDAQAIALTRLANSYGGGSR